MRNGKRSESATSSGSDQSRKSILRRKLAARLAKSNTDGASNSIRSTVGSSSPAGSAVGRNESGVAGGAVGSLLDTERVERPTRRGRKAAKRAVGGRRGNRRERGADGRYRPSAAPATAPATERRAGASENPEIDLGMHHGHVGDEPTPEPRPRPYQTEQTQTQKDFEENLRLGAQAGFLGLVFHSAFFALSTFRGPHWVLQPHETQKLASDYTKMFDAILPDEWKLQYDGVLKKFGPVFAAGLTTVSIVGPRLAYDEQLRHARQAAFDGAGTGEHSRSGFADGYASGFGPTDGSTDPGNGGHVQN
jgi:hypothetical protein